MTQATQQDMGLSDERLREIYSAGRDERLSDPTNAELALMVTELLRLRTATPAPEWQGMRDERQHQVAEWCAAAFGADHQASVPQRGLRMLEEAIEAYQATTGTPETAHRLVDYIFAKEPGELAQELGGIGVTVLALAAAAGLSAEEAETREVARVLSKPLAWFHARNKVKNDAGFDATAYPFAPIKDTAK